MENKTERFSLPLVQGSFDLSVKVYEHVNRFPRAHKTLLGRDLLSAAQGMLVSLTAASKSRKRTPLLEEADIHLERLRILVRLAHRLTFLPHKGYETLSVEMVEIGRMLGGWIKATRGVTPELTEEPGAAPFGEEKTKKGPKTGRSAVSYTMTSPKVEEYLKMKLARPNDIVMVKTGIFYKTFFEDALFLNKRLNLKITESAAESEAERIPSCGFPVNSIDKFRERLAPPGRVLYLPE